MAYPNSAPGAIPVETRERRPASNPKTLKWVRKAHLYLGLFISPALLFFAFTGAVQTLSLHEAAGSSYTPPSWLARLGQLHKNQNIHPRKPRPVLPEAGSKNQSQQPGPAMAGARVADTPATGAPSAVAPAAGAAAAPAKPPVSLAAKQRQHLPEKIFFLLVSLGLASSTGTGIFMAYKYERGKLLVTALLLAGIAVPLLLLPF